MDIKTKNNSVFDNTLAICPECNSPLFRNGGCVYCPVCGWSSCNS